MYIFLITIIIILTSLYLRDYKKLQRQTMELSYISDKVEKVLLEGSKEFILLSTELKSIKIILTSVNHLLEVYYREQINYQKSQKVMKQGLTNVSHDLKSPLTVLKGYSDMLCLKCKREKIDNDMERNIWKINNNIKDIIRLVNQYFNMAKLESGDTIINIQKINISKVCKDSILEYYDILEEKEFKVNIQITGKPIYASTDESSLLRILENLIDNAIKYGEKGKFLGINLEEGEGLISIYIEDHGDGISDDKKELIFERAYILEDKKRRHYQGSGLGLAISRNLAKQIGAVISVNSQPGRTVFSLKLIKS